MTDKMHLHASLALAFAAMFAAPAAVLAQDGTAPQAAAQPAASSDPQSAAQPANASGKKSWADLDVDRNGSLDRQEASALPALAKVFDQADGNADGALTGDEYRAYLDANGHAPAHAKR